MNRREVIGAFAGLVGVVAMSDTKSRKIGCLTVESHRAHMLNTGENLHVYLDGVELQKVYEADDIEGYELIYCRDPDTHRDMTRRGAVHLRSDGSGVCRLRVNGNIEFRV